MHEEKTTPVSKKPVVETSKNVVEMLGEHSNIRQIRDKRGFVFQWVDDNTPKSETQPETQTLTPALETSQVQHNNKPDNNDDSIKEYLQTFDELANQDERHLASGKKFTDILTSKYGLSQNDATTIIMKVEIARNGIEDISYTIEGLQYPTLEEKECSSDILGHYYY